MTEGRCGLGHNSLKIFRAQSGSAGDPCQHAWADLLPFVKGKDEVRPPFPGQDSVRSARLTLETPANLKEGCEDEARFR
jgi:hypothetical protein